MGFYIYPVIIVIIFFIGLVLIISSDPFNSVIGLMFSIIAVLILAGIMIYKEVEEELREEIRQEEVISTIKEVSEEKLVEIKSENARGEYFVVAGEILYKVYFEEDIILYERVENAIFD